MMERPIHIPAEAVGSSAPSASSSTAEAAAMVEQARASY